MVQRSDASELSAQPKNSDRDALLRSIYSELREIARRQMRKERANHTLQPTAVVHEAYLRMSAERKPDCPSPEHFKSLCALAIRRLLADHARRRQAGKRGAGWARVTLDERVMAGELSPEEFLDLDGALGELRCLDQRQAEVVQMRFFGGLSVPETAHVLGCSPRTVDTDWHMARAWLRRRLAENQKTE